MPLRKLYRGYRGRKRAMAAGSALGGFARKAKAAPGRAKRAAARTIGAFKSGAKKAYSKPSAGQAFKTGAKKAYTRATAAAGSTIKRIRGSRLVRKAESRANRFLYQGEGARLKKKATRLARKYKRKAKKAYKRYTAKPAAPKGYAAQSRALAQAKRGKKTKTRLQRVGSHLKRNKYAYGAGAAGVAGGYALAPRRKKRN